MKIGYARVSTKEQNLNLQIEALQNADCEKIYQEKTESLQGFADTLESLIEESNVWNFNN